MKLLQGNMFYSFARNHFRRLATATKFPGKKIEIESVNIHYEEIGNGQHKVLLIPGGLGTGRTDFKPQIEQLDKSKFTLISWDPPGYGYSRPPDRTYPRNFYYRDAHLGAGLMQKLGHQKYSSLGWSDGGSMAMIIAASYPDVIQKIVVWGTTSYFTDRDVNMLDAARDIKQWNKKMLETLFAIYGEEYTSKMWHEHVGIIEQIAADGGDICRNDLQKIKCPTLILHGDKDPLVLFEHPLYLLKYIKNSKLHRIPEGKHNIHLRYAKEFNDIVTNFLLE